jgi:dTDP-4-amino-4,6-dideoxygalactose transaminase
MQFIDLQKQYSLYKDEIDKAIQSIITQTNFINGKEIDLLEQEITDYI